MIIIILTVISIQGLAEKFGGPWAMFPPSFFVFFVPSSFWGFSLA